MNDLTVRIVTGRVVVAVVVYAWGTTARRLYRLHSAA